MPVESSKKYSVLIVDDDPSVRLVVSRSLSLNNYETLAIDNAPEALVVANQRMANGENFDLVVCDIHMPEMDGLEFLNELKKIDPAVASVVITGSNDVEIALKAMKSGALGFIPKPFTIPELLETIRAALRSAEMVRETLGNKVYVDMLENASKALLNALEAKDRENQGHSERVKDYSVEMARHLMGSSELNDIYFAALFHDVGKISIPDSILYKTSSLTPDEQKKVMEHPVVGARIIGKVQGLERAAEIIRYHHENFDGSGYPKGLTGEDIPLGSRIIAVADRFDDLTRDTGREMLAGIREALEFIKKERGRMFDPAIVDLFLEIEEKELSRKVID